MCVRERVSERESESEIARGREWERERERECVHARVRGAYRLASYARLS